MDQPFSLDRSERTETAKLAATIFEDIRERGLKAGERYLNGQEIADKYGVTLITANRALQSLAERNVLERRRRAGTFISGTFSDLPPGRVLRCVHLLMPLTYFRFARHSVEEALFGIHSELPEANIQHTFLPVSGEVAFVRQLLEQAAERNCVEGMVLFVSSVELQQFVHETRVPAVVFGSVFPETSQLPWIDRDQRQIGELLAGFLVKEGHGHVAVLMRERWGYGDNLLLDGVQQVFSSATPAVAFRVRSAPAIEEAAVATIQSLLKTDRRPTAVICRSEKLAQATLSAALGLKLKVPQELRIVVAESTSVYPSVQPIISQEEQGRMIGRMLKQLGSGQPPEPHSVLVPVQLHHPHAS